MREAFKHQVSGSKFLKARKGAILADEMGLGKTRQEIDAIGNDNVDLHVIVCPASLKLNWKREILMVYPEEGVYVSGGKQPFNGKLDAWYIVNYDQLGKHVGVILDSGKFTLTGDEAHYIKGNSARTKYFMILADAAARVHLLTGTPVLNRPVELFNLLKAIRHPVAKLKGKYAERYCGAVPMARIRDKLNNRHFIVHRSQAFGFMHDRSQYQVMFYVDMRGATNLGELKEQIAGSFLRRTKKEVMDLPEKIETMVPVELKPAWRKKYASAFDDYLDFLSSNPMEGKNLDNIMLARHMVELQKLKQVCSEAKIDAVTEAIEDAVEQGEKVVVFTQYTKTLMDLADRVGRLGIVTLQGSTSQDRRQAAVDSFQSDEKVRVFIGNIKAAGIGITLTASTQVIFADLDWTPAVHDQAADRCHRIGQTGTVNVRYFFVPDSVEEDVLEMLAQKREVITAILEGGDVHVERSAVKEVIDRLSTRASK